MSSATEELRVRRAEGAMRALVRVGEDLLGKAQRLAPVDTGALRASASLAFLVNGDRFEGEKAYEAAYGAARRLARQVGGLRSLDVEVSFATVYAAYQHEELDLDHPKGGQAKYLEQPLGESAPSYRRALELEDELAQRG